MKRESERVAFLGISGVFFQSFHLELQTLSLFLSCPSRTSPVILHRCRSTRLHVRRCRLRVLRREGSAAERAGGEAALLLLLLLWQRRRRWQMGRRSDSLLLLLLLGRGRRRRSRLR